MVVQRKDIVRHHIWNTVGFRGNLNAFHRMAICSYHQIISFRDAGRVDFAWRSVTQKLRNYDLTIETQNLAQVIAVYTSPPQGLYMSNESYLLESSRAP